MRGRCTRKACKGFKPRGPLMMKLTCYAAGGVELHHLRQEVQGLVTRLLHPPQQRLVRRERMRRRDVLMTMVDGANASSSSSSSSPSLSSSSSHSIVTETGGRLPGGGKGPHVSEYRAEGRRPCLVELQVVWELLITSAVARG